VDEAQAVEPEQADIELDDDDGEVIVRGRSKRVVAWLVLLVVGGAVAAAFVALVVGDPFRSRADPGLLSETAWPRPEAVPPLMLTDVTDDWQLISTAVAPAGAPLDPMVGGMATADLNTDGNVDLVVAHGSLQVFLWRDGAYGQPISLDVANAMAVTAADLDDDGWTDLLVARDGDRDTVFWGGPWIEAGTEPERTEFAGAAPSAGLLAGELSGDSRIDIVQLGRGRERGVPDVLWVADASEPRQFDPIRLSDDERYSLAGELVDVDLDGLLDIWVTRDVGWDTGGDSVFSRQGEPEGPWVDIAPDLGLDLAIDAMGVTVADLDGDADLDAYVSDLGDNEVMIRGDDGYQKAANTGAARIRPVGAPDAVVSSSWASGAADLNLDGRLDLVVANGGFPNGGMRNKIPFTDVTVQDSPALLLGIGDGRYVDVWAELEIDWDAPSRGLTIGDFDGDGDDDLVFLADDGAMRAFRNDSMASSITIAADPGCDTSGAVVTATQGDLVYQALLQPHTYGGAHRVGATIGVVDPNLTVEVRWPGGQTVDATPTATGDRPEVLIDCPADLG